MRIASGKVLRILSNDLDLPARKIADLYKRRWQIELFFRWVKQTLKIKHFLGRSENAVRIQIAVALIAFLLLRLDTPRNAPFQARLSSPASCAQTSCTDDRSTVCSNLLLQSNKIAAS